MIVRQKWMVGSMERKECQDLWKGKIGQIVGKIGKHLGSLEKERSLKRKEK